MAGFLDKLRFHVGDPVGLVVDKLSQWRPRGCKNEKEFENSLYRHLHEALGDIQVTKQFQHGRIRADLAIGEKVIVELKHNLDSTAKLQRLMGQITEYKQWDGRVVILLTGKTEPNIGKRLREVLKQEGLSEDDFYDGVAVTVFER